MEPGVGKSPSCRDTYGDAGARDKVDWEKIYRDDGKRFIVRADEKLTAFVELESAIYEFALDLIS